MVWAKTTDIGCGVASCPMYCLSIVCNYGPGGNWNNEKPYEVKSRELCPKMQNIPKDSFQTMRDGTQRAALPIVNINNKLSTTGSSRRNKQRKWRSGKKSLDKFSKSVRDGSGHGNVQRQHNGRIPRY
ncbi:unnamed protein product [Schistosoma mattheei]|uniref:Uncharacterized protein n=1 Tax=Schistosoma mattheei TaxID=31246 RepID=A0A183PW36_9TREM|nr:unnamed protein product [Schistosoma mattheei]